MFGSEPVKPSSKFYLTHGPLPKFIDPAQPPSKKKPFSTILNQLFTHTVDLIIPQELYDLVWKSVEAKISGISYSRVIMSLSELLEGDFFNVYIKTGNIMMLSEGRAGIDNLYYLKEGRLTLELSKESYERGGLVGKPIRDSGRKHVKTRYSVEVDLRLPSMVHGKKGFERIVWAFKNVLNNAVTWLFYDFHEEGTTTDSRTESISKAIDKHHPTRVTCLPSSIRTPAVLVPNLSTIHTRTTDSYTDFKEWAIEMHEWLGLVALESPRVQASDSIDPYLCRYQVPDNENATPSDIIVVRWTGFLPAEWVRSLFVSCMKEARLHQNLWFALSGSSFKIKVVDQQDGFTILRLPRQNNHTADEGEGVSEMADELARKSPPEEQMLEQFIAWEHIDTWQAYS